MAKGGLVVAKDWFGSGQRGFASGQRRLGSGLVVATGAW